MTHLTRRALLRLVTYDQNTGVMRKINRTYAKNHGRGTDGWIDGYGYRKMYIAGRTYPLHRLAWLCVYGAWPIGVIDHIDFNPLNNRIANLRECSIADNVRKQRRHHDAIQRFKGVTTVHWRKGWRARIKVKRREIWLGVFDKPDDAARAYDRAATFHFGLFAVTNKSLGLLP